MSKWHIVELICKEEINACILILTEAGCVWQPEHRLFGGI